MKTSILSLIAIFSIISVQAQKRIKGNGNVKTITRTTSEYDGVKCSGSFDYILVAGAEGTITLEGEENLLEHIITEVKEGHLVIRTENNVNLNTSNDKTIKVTIPFKDIDHVSLAGSGDLISKDKIASDKLKVALAGSGDIVLQVESNSAVGSISGSGDLTLKGNTNELKVQVAGSGNFHGFELQANETDVSVAGSGDADVVCNEKLKANVAGSGNIVYKGSPKIEDTNVSGSGSIESH